MSKAKLKKELSTMSSDQLMDIIINAYDARKEFKEYFEFFLNPDVLSMMAQVEENVIKECRKSKHGYAKFKISHIKTLIKNFQGLNPGAEYVTRMMVVTIFQLMDMARCLYITDNQYDTISKFVKDTLKYADKNACYVKAVTELLEFCNSEAFNNRYIKSLVIAAIEDHQASIR